MVTVFRAQEYRYYQTVLLFKIFMQNSLFIMVKILVKHYLKAKERTSVAEVVYPSINVTPPLNHFENPCQE